MDKNDLKKTLRPLVKALVKEAMQEELSTVISEIIKQTAGSTSIVERKQPTIDPKLQSHYNYSSLSSLFGFAIIDTFT